MSEEPQDVDGRRARARRSSFNRDPSPDIRDLGPVVRTRHHVSSRGSGRGRPPRALVIPLLVAVIAALALVGVLHGRSDQSVTSPPKHPAAAVVFMVQGLDSRDINSQVTPNIWALMQGGTKYREAWVGQAESASVAGAATLGTGTQPARNGVVGWLWSPSDSNRIQAPAAFGQVQLGHLDSFLQHRHVPSFAASIKHLRPKMTSMAVSGENCALADAAGTWAADFVLCARQTSGHWAAGAVIGHALPANSVDVTGLGQGILHDGSVGAQADGWPLGQQNRWIGRYAMLAMRSQHPRLIYVILPELEQVTRGTSVALKPAARRQILQSADAAVGDVVRTAASLFGKGRTLFALTSDQNLVPIHRLLPRSDILGAIVASGGQTVYLQGDMADFLGLQNRFQVKPAALMLRRTLKPYLDAIAYKHLNLGRWEYRLAYLRPGLPQNYGAALRQVLSTMTSRLSPDIVLVHRPGIATRQANRVSGTLGAGGLGLDWSHQHVPLILTGPGVYANFSSPYPARLTDIVPTLARVLGAPLANSDGVVLADALRDSSALERGRQSRRGRALATTVRALQSH